MFIHYSQMRHMILYIHKEPKAKRLIQLNQPLNTHLIIKISKMHVMISFVTHALITIHACNKPLK
ncbi:hypothetical protein QJS10_CPB18g00402 [Acorus calamus]|uniref:Uncharacterized protein n=1 Tax=Acorus calamus TaxID=4465 RepID=A0AAV9CL66_ACOCL|nr:hypothetical protein QJS10_CPB18g00402 [Acorus calamus]